MGLVAQRDLQWAYGLISSYIQQSSFITLSSQIGKTLAKRRMQKTREPTLLCVEYTISTPGSSR